MCSPGKISYLSNVDLSRWILRLEEGEVRTLSFPAGRWRTGGTMRSPGGEMTDSWQLPHFKGNSEAWAAGHFGVAKRQKTKGGSRGRRFRVSGDKKNKQGSWRKRSLVRVKQLSGETHTHTHTHTHIPTFIKEISDSPTTQSTFKLHLGEILSKDYNLCRLKMTVKMLIFLNPQIVLWVFIVSWQVLQRAHLSSLSLDSLEIPVPLVPVATTAI